MNKEELVYDDIKKALNQFRREDLLNDGMGHDIDTGIGVSITIREMVKYIRQQKEIDRLNNIINIKNDYIIQLHNLIYKTDNPNLQFALHIKQEKYLKDLKEDKE